jgi:hypothetical protein
MAQINKKIMEKYKIEQDIKLFYVQADSFLLGVGGGLPDLRGPEGRLYKHLFV